MLGRSFRCIPLGSLRDAPPLIEDGNNFAANATQKAVQLAQWLAWTPSSEFRTPNSEFYVLADDSGLEVDALDGAPGVHSARFSAVDTRASGNSSDAENNAKLLRLLKDVPREKRTARFRCVLALTPVLNRTTANASPVCYADELEFRTELFEGACEGRIDFAPRGEGGFGYDPLFVPNGYEQSFAELGDETKNRLSHRAQALAKLRQRLVSGP